MDIKTQSELRRKKILENAEARLRKITGKPLEKVDVPNVSTADVSLQERKETKYQLTNGSTCNGSFSNRQDLFDDLDIGNESGVLKEAEEIFSRPNTLIDDITALRNTSNVLERPTVKYEFYFFLLLGLVVRLLFYLGLSWLFINNILGPFIIACVPRLSTIFSREVRPSGFMGLVTLLYSNQQRFVLPIKIFYGMRTISQLFALYLFSFTLTDFFISDHNS